MNELKNETTIDPKFSKMLSMAKAYFNSANLKKHEYHQCLVLSTAQDEEKIYSLNCDSVQELVNQSCAIFSQEKVAPIKKIVCMWEGGAIDVPSHQFMTMLCDVNAENKKAEILLRGLNAYITKKIADIIG